MSKKASVKGSSRIRDKAQEQATRAQALNELAAVKASIQKQAERHNFYVWLVMLVLTLAAGLLVALHPGAWPACLGIFFPLGWLAPSTRPLTRAEYYQLPLTRDDAGKHICIHCGNKGLTRSPGPIEKALHSCSRCEQPLFKGFR